MEGEEFRRRWDELKEGEEFRRMQHATNILSILSWGWVKASKGSDTAKSIWEGAGNASSEATKIIMEHIPSQDQQRAFGIIADLMEYTFVISAHEKDRKEAKEHSKKIIDAKAEVTANARRALEPISRIKRQVIKDVAEQLWEKNATFSGNIRGTALAILDKINPLIAERCAQEGIDKPDDIKVSAVMGWLRKVLAERS